MKHFFYLLRWEMAQLTRNNLLTISAAVTLLYIALFQLLKLLGYQELFAILIVLNDPALIGFLFVAIMLLFEKESGSLAALRVTPMRLHSFLLAKLILLSMLGALCGWAMAIALLGWDIHHGMFVGICFLITFLFGSLGVGMVARINRFVDFMLPMAGALVVMVLPLAEWFGLFRVPLKWIFPLEHGVRLMAWSFRYQVHVFPWMSLLVFVVCSAGFYFWGARRFRRFNF